MDSLHNALKTRNASFCSVLVNSSSIRSGAKRDPASAPAGTDTDGACLVALLLAPPPMLLPPSGRVPFWPRRLLLLVETDRTAVVGVSLRMEGVAFRTNTSRRSSDSSSLMVCRTAAALPPLMRDSKMPVGHTDTTEQMAFFLFTTCLLCDEVSGISSVVKRGRGVNDLCACIASGAGLNG